MHHYYMVEVVHFRDHHVGVVVLSELPTHSSESVGFVVVVGQDEHSFRFE